MSVSVLVFPGTNCDQDIISATYEIDPEIQVTRNYYHEESLPAETNILFLAGGFAYGDYLRVGALAKTAPIMKDVHRFADNGGRVVGICNGFQILCDAGLLPGALLPHESGLFHSRPVATRLCNTTSTVLSNIPDGASLRLPLSNHGGRFYASSSELAEIENYHGVFLEYAMSENLTDDTLSPLAWNPVSGSFFADHELSCLSIAGIRNKAASVYGLMPHPERAVSTKVGGVCSDDGKMLFRAFLDT